MVDTREPQISRTPFNYNLEVEFGNETTLLYSQLLKNLNLHLDPKITSPFNICFVEIANRVLNGKTNFIDDKLDSSLNELKKLKDYRLIEKDISQNSFDMYLNSWSHFLLTGKHLYENEELKILANKGIKYALKSIKKLSDESKNSIDDINELSNASLFLTLSKLRTPGQFKDLNFLKSKLILASREHIKDLPNVYNEDKQIAILNAYSNYVLAKTTEISVNADGNLNLSFP